MNVFITRLWQVNLRRLPRKSSKSDAWCDVVFKLLHDVPTWSYSESSGIGLGHAERRHAHHRPCGPPGLVRGIVERLDGIVSGLREQLLPLESYTYPTFSPGPLRIVRLYSFSGKKINNFFIFVLFLKIIFQRKTRKKMISENPIWLGFQEMYHKISKNRFWYNFYSASADYEKREQGTVSYSYIVHFNILDLRIQFSLLTWSKRFLFCKHCTPECAASCGCLRKRRRSLCCLEKNSVRVDWLLESQKSPPEADRPIWK